MKKNHLKLMCISGIFAAVVFVVTAYLHVPTYNGYVHFGDGFILKLYTFFVYDLLEMGPIYYIKRLCRKRN